MTSAPIPHALALLADERNVAADAALAEAMPHLSEPALSAAFELLARRGHPSATAAVVAAFHDAYESLKTIMVHRVGALQGGIRRAITSDEFNDRAGAIELIVRADDAKSADLLAEAIRSRCPRTRELAAAGLETMTAALLDHLDAALIDAESGDLDVRREALAAALGHAVLGWELHLQPGVLRAALWMDDWVGGALRKKIAEPRTKIVHMLRDLVDGASDRRMAGFLLRALAIPDLRAAAAGTISRAHDPDLIVALIRRADVLDDSEVQRGCRWIRGGGWLHSSIAAIVHDDATLAPGAVRLLAASGGSHSRKIEVYGSLLNGQYAELQVEVIRRLAEDESAAATALLMQVAHRANDPVAPLAARALEQRDDRNVESIRTPAPPIDGVATTDVSGADALTLYFDRFDRLDANQRAELARRIAATLDQKEVHFRAKLAVGDARVRCRGLALAGEIGIVPRLAEQVHRLARDPDATVRREAVALLEHVPGATTERILRSVVDDPDERVQANAVEAADRLDLPDRAEWTEAKLDSTNSRVRANAVKSLLRMEHRGAGETLIDMLSDSSESHRLSALWVIELLRLDALTHRVRLLQTSDVDPRVREQAARALRVLTADHQGGDGPSHQRVNAAARFTAGDEW